MSNPLFPINIIKKDILKCENIFFLARPKGFEPLIFRIGIYCVIQLRHGRKFIFYLT
mgnify:CR=1 FL=1